MHVYHGSSQWTPLLYELVDSVNFISYQSILIVAIKGKINGVVKNNDVAKTINHIGPILA